MATVGHLVPPLVAGDKLSREEFLSRWEAHPEIMKAELIGGIVYMPSPVTIEHGDSEGAVGTWLGVYSAATPGTASGHNTTSFVIDDCPQPDVNLRILPECGGASREEGKYLHGAPELLAEICRSSSSYDLHQKLDLYQAAGVQEYLAMLLFEREVRWHALEDGIYQVLPADPDGIWRSRIFPGLWLDGRALLAGDIAQVLATLQAGIASPAHQAFVDRLSDRK
jgi:Uma2 family endonuclease